MVGIKVVRKRNNMACSCPKNVNNGQTKARETTTEKPADITPTPKLTKPLEEAMAEEERAEYLDAWDMGQDFWSARA